MSVVVKSADRAGEKFVNAAQAATQAYNDGVSNPKVPWDQATAAAEDAYKSGVAAAAAAGRFGKGVRKAGGGKYLKGAKEKGSVRFGPGVATARQAYQDGVSPYLSVISGLTLPPRRARRDPGNLQRVAVVAAALGQKKESMLK